jgi:hypothetical protein
MRGPTGRPRPFLLCLASASACTAPVAPITSSAAAQEICAEARRAALPSVAMTDRNLGIITRGDYRKTELPRADGTVAVVLTGVSSTVRRGGREMREHRSLAYVENRRCWDAEERGIAGYYSCYDLDRPGAHYPNLIRDTDTRRFLSVVTFLVTGGRSDDAARIIAAGRATIVPMEMELTHETSGPSMITAWYLCQSCGNENARPERPAAAAAMTFGRSTDATFIITREGIVAKLPDGRDQATYADCRNKDS